MIFELIGLGISAVTKGTQISGGRVAQGQALIDSMYADMEQQKQIQTMRAEVVAGEKNKSPLLLIAGAVLFLFLIFKR